MGYFIEPTVVQTTDPRFKLMEEEIFGPVLTVFVYDDDRSRRRPLRLCDETSPYGLTGAIFANDRMASIKMAAALRHAAGNFYINDKPTGAVVGQQPFGGGRASGTNDKAGSTGPTCCAGPRSGPSRKPSCRRNTLLIRSWVRSSDSSNESRWLSLPLAPRHHRPRPLPRPISLQVCPFASLNFKAMTTQMISATAETPYDTPTTVMKV